MKVQVLVRLKPGVLDVQGKAVERSLVETGSAAVHDVRIGKLIEMVVDAPSFEEAKAQVSKLCDTLLVNPIIENYEIREA